MIDKKIILHLVSDSTGETLETITKATISQFENVELEICTWSLVRNRLDMQTAIDVIKKRQGVVLYTILAKDLEELLQEECARLNITCIPAIKHIILAFQDYLKVENLGMSGRQHSLNNEYYRQIEAIEYTIDHDDGARVDRSLKDADVILIGVSRTSKTPTSIYLSYKGLKVANIPFVDNERGIEKIYDTISSLRSKKCIIGFSISPERLRAIREARLQSLGHDPYTSDYANLDYIKNEIRSCLKFLNRLDATVINVTEKSVEEVCVHIKAIHKRFISRPNDKTDGPEG